MIVEGDRALIQIVDAALAEAARKAGSWLVCRPGCTQCCIGPFAINALDAFRLRRGLTELETRDAGRAERVRLRVRQSIERLSHDFPGDPGTGLLSDDEAAFDAFANDEVCPVLDPETGLCDLYDARPMTCRVFGPPLRTGSEEFGVCELCFDGATGAEVAACAVELDVSGREAALSEQLGPDCRTIVAFSLAP